MPLDPEALAHLDRVAAAGIPPFEAMSPTQARDYSERGAAALAGPKPVLARVENRSLPGPAGPIPARIYSSSDQSSADPQPVVAYFHGGGWVIGSLDTHDVAGRSLAALAGCLVVSVDYRLAPEHPYPAAVEDCWAAVHWLSEHAAELGGDRDRIAVVGDSAGGNLAAAVALRARDSGLRLACQQLIYPVLDCDLETDSYRTSGTGFGLTRAAMAAYWDHYLPDPERRLEPAASPLRASDLRGLAPALVVVCEFDPLLTEGEAYGLRLRQAGVPVVLSRYQGMIHGFLRMGAVLSRTAQLHREMAAHLREAFSSGLHP